MKGYFENQENMDRLRAAVARWHGTPFRHRAGVCGVGTDCIHFVVKVLLETGALKKMPDIPAYARDWHLHRGNELLVTKFMEHKDVVEIPTARIQNGDIVFFKYGRATAHAGFKVDNNVFHSHTTAGVVRTDINDKSLMKRLTHACRIVES